MSYSIHLHELPRQGLLAAVAACEGVVREILLGPPSDPILQGMDLDTWPTNS